MDLTNENVFFKTTINWDEPNFYSGITPIKKAHITEILDALTIISNAIDAHSATGTIDSAHGRVTTTGSGFLSKELYNRVYTLIARINNLIAEIPQKAAPSKIITAYDKSIAPPMTVPTGYSWCNGYSNPSKTDSKGKVFIGAYSGSPQDNYPDGVATHVDPVDALGQKAVTQYTTKAVFLERN